MDTLTGDGVEMMPFHNIFNEWYAAQTSKKIRAVWQSKAEHGERIASIVPYGYRKSEDNPKQWVIDEPAAQTDAQNSVFGRSSPTRRRPQKTLCCCIPLCGRNPLPEPIDENEKINLSQEILPRSPDIRIESGKLVRFSGENEFSYPQKT